MKLTVFDNLDRYYQIAQHHLLEHEAANCLLLAISLGFRDSDRQQIYAASVKERGKIAATAIHFPPRKLLLSKSSNPLAVELIARNLAAGERSIAGMTAPQAEAETFVDTWQSLTKKPVELEVSLLVQQLETIKPTNSAAGKERLAIPKDIELLTDWIQQFAKEALNINESRANSRQWVIRNMEQNSLFVWQNGKNIVSMAAYGGRTPNGIRVKSVYTPSEHRSKGYATSLVSVMSQHLLEQHRYCFLFTDAVNSISNRIYHKIGYVRVADLRDYNFYSP